MLQLIDGTCKGTYFCKRVPVFLRAVEDGNGNKDVLDLIDDTPKPTEKVYVYKLEGEPGWMHIHGTKIHGFYATGTYRHMPDVDGETLRNNEDWQKWATAHFEG